ncbi:hypothetical protein [Thermomonas sp.]|uniref:hypothetical protein n=1 Tax=Thermomonas sp. TaxID=1971895 RepID=UPI0031F2D7E2
MAARNIEKGGSLTIIATALVDTGSAMGKMIQRRVLRFDEVLIPWKRFNQKAPQCGAFLLVASSLGRRSTS